MRVPPRTITIADGVDVAAWRRLRRAVHHELYEDMVGTIYCGPFDGGCLVFARALVDVVGGELAVVVRPDGRADHAAAMHAGRLWDWDGPTSPRRFLTRFNRSEMASCVDWRPFREGDLPDAPEHEALRSRIACLIRRALTPHVAAMKAENASR